MSVTASKLPWLLYAYPWMPFPRRVILYLREKNIPSSTIQVVPVSDPQLGDRVLAPGFPPRPSGSLPILVVPSADSSSSDNAIHIRQSVAIINFIDEHCDNNGAGLLAEEEKGFPRSAYPLRGATPLERARVTEIQTLAEELTAQWNPVRLFGTGAGPFSAPEAARESLRWIGRSLKALDGLYAGRDVKGLAKGGAGRVHLGDIVLYQFLEFVKDCYGRDLTVGSGQAVEDVYGRGETEERYENLRAFFEAFRTRDSARRDAELGEVPGEAALAAMTKWADGV